MINGIYIVIAGYVGFYVYKDIEKENEKEKKRTSKLEDLKRLETDTLRAASTIRTPSVSAKNLLKKMKAEVKNSPKRFSRSSATADPPAIELMELSSSSQTKSSDEKAVASSSDAPVVTVAAVTVALERGVDSTSSSSSLSVSLKPDSKTQVATPATGLEGLDESKLRVAKKTYKSKYPQAMSYVKGDIIEETSAGKKGWCTGILRRSSQYPVTGIKLKYPELMVRPYLNPTKASSVDAVSNTDKKKRETSKYFVATGSFTGKKLAHMSFSKGDIIEIINKKGNRNLGILRQSKNHEITGKKLYVPSNYIKVCASVPQSLGTI